MVFFLIMTHSWERANRQLAKIKCQEICNRPVKGGKNMQRQLFDRPNEEGRCHLVRAFYELGTVYGSSHTLFPTILFSYQPIRVCHFHPFTVEDGHWVPFQHTGIYAAIKHVHWGKSHQPHLWRTVESGPSGCLQLAPLTGNHQGAAATSKQPRKAEVSDDDSRKHWLSMCRGKKNLMTFNFHFSYQTNTFTRISKIKIYMWVNLQ